MLIIAGTIRFPAENIAAARDELGKVAAASRAEEGCEAYAFAEDVIEPGLFQRGVDGQVGLGHRPRAFVLFPMAEGAAPVGQRDPARLLGGTGDEVEVSFRQRSFLRPEGWGRAGCASRAGRWRR